MLHENQRRTRKNQRKGNYFFRNRKANAPREIHYLDFNPETEASLREKWRVKRKREFKIAVALIGLMALMSLGRLVVQEAFLNNPEFRLQHFSVSTAGDLTPEEIVAATGLRDGENLLMISLRVVRQRLEALPEVRSAEVSRQYPGVLALHVHQREGVAWVQAGEQTGATKAGSFRCLVDDEGTVLRHTANHPEHDRLPVITVDKPSDSPHVKLAECPQVVNALKLLHEHQNSSMAQTLEVASINATGPYALVAKYSPGGLVTTFGTRNLEKQVHRLALIVADAAARQNPPLNVNLLAEINVPVTYRNSDHELAPPVLAVTPAARRHPAGSRRALANAE